LKRPEVGSTVHKALRSAVKAVRKFAYNQPESSGARESGGRRLRVGLALGGGFARGLAHVGVLKVLTENHIPIDALAGTSAGSVAAAALASGCSLDEIVEATRRIRWSNFARWTIPRLGLASNERMEAMLRGFLHCTTFEELHIPLAVVATDISTGEAVIFRSGDLIQPLRASCSFPGLFTPVQYRGRLLVDGVIAGSVPVAALSEMNVDLVIAVHLKTGGPRHTPTNIFQIVGEAFQIAQSQNQATWRQFCDLVIEPNVEGFRWDDFDRAQELIVAGESAAFKVLPALRGLVRPPPLPAPVPLVAR
jgi:NTE family protein